MAIDETRLEAAAECISDGEPVDWVQLGGAAEDEDDRAVVENLLLISHVASLHRESDGGSTDGHVAASCESAGDRIGPYRLIERIGQGGMGEVYLAEQERPLRRRVALKVIKLGMDTRLVVARFEAERQALAMMEHPCIAKVYDAGVTDRGRPYFAMELVTGARITDYCDQHRLSIPQRLRLFAQVCRAVLHAHQKGVIHRDLKPSNVLIAVQDGQPLPKVIDFGIAKAVEQRLTDRTMQTAFGELIGTPEYMSPEQADLTGFDVDTRSDVYSLGVILYELLVGALPFAPASLRSQGIEGIRSTLRDKDPERPSDCLARARDAALHVAESRRTMPAALRRQLQHELDWIVLRAMEKDRSRRYQTAEELAADIERALSDEPVLARPPSMTYRLRKSVKRHKGAFTAAAAVAAAILLFGTVSVREARRAKIQERKATTEGYRARANGILAAATALRDPLKRALLVHELESMPDLTVGQLTRALDLVRVPLPIAVFGVERDNADIGSTAVVAMSADASHVAVGTRAGSIRVFRTDAPASPSILVDGASGSESAPLDLAFSPDGRRVVACAWDRAVRVYPVDGGPEIVIGTGVPAVRAVFNPRGDRIVTASPDGSIRVWPTHSTGAPIVFTGHTDEIQSIRFDARGERFVTASLDGTARVWSGDQGRPVVLRGHSEGVTAAEFSLDGQRIVTASSDGTARVWQSDGGGRPIVLRGHRAGLRSAAFSPDGGFVITGSSDGTARLWRADGTREPEVLAGHDAGLVFAGFNPDGAQILTASSDGTALVWARSRAHDPFGNVMQQVPATMYRGRRIRFAARVRVEDRAGTGRARIYIRVYGREATALYETPREDAISHRDWREHIVEGDVPADATTLTLGMRLFDSGRVWMDGARIEIAGEAAAGVGGELRDRAESVRDDGGLIDGGFESARLRWIHTGNGWAAQTVEEQPFEGKRCLRLEHSGAPAWRPTPVASHGSGIHFASFASGGRCVLTAATDGTARLWTVGSRGEPIVLEHEKPLERAGFSPDGRRVVTACDDQVARVWALDGSDRASGQPILLRGHTAALFYAAFSPDSDRIATASGDRTARIWSAQGDGPPIVLAGHEGGVYSAVFSGDGSRVVTASSDRTARVWRADGSGTPVVLRGHRELVEHAVFSPDGVHVATASDDHTVRIWRADGIGEAVVLEGHRGPVESVAFSPDGTRVVSASDDRTVRIWPANGRGEPIVFAGEDVMQCAAFSPDGDRIAAASEDGTIRVWRTDGTGEGLVLGRHADAAYSVEFSADGRRVVSASEDGTARVWSASWEALFEYLRTHLHVCLIPADRMRYLDESRAEAVARHATFCAAKEGHQLLDAPPAVSP